MTLDKIEVRNRYETHGNNSANTLNSDIATSQMLEMRKTEYIESQCEKFVYLLCKNGLTKYQSYIQEGHLKGTPKPAPGMAVVQAAGAIVGAAIGTPFGLIGTGAAIGAEVCLIYDFVYGQLHREKAKEIAKLIAHCSIDKDMVLNIFASIGAEVFRVFEYQLASPEVEVSDLKKVAHDVVVRVYTAIVDDPDIWQEGERTGGVALAKSATERRTILDKIIRGCHLETQRTKDLLSKAGIYDHKDGKYFCSKNTDSIKHKFRLPFKYEEIKPGIWNEVDATENGSFQPKYFVTEDMITRVKQNAISKVIAENLEMSSTQNASDAEGGKNTWEATKIQLNEHYEKRAEEARKSEIEKEKIDKEVASSSKLHTFLTYTSQNMNSQAEKSGEIAKTMHHIQEQKEQNNQLEEQTKCNLQNVNKNVAYVREFLQPKSMIKKFSKVNETDLNYVQRSEPYGQLKKFFEEQKEDILQTQRVAVIVGDPGVGKSDIARKVASEEFKGKVLWIDATTEEIVTKTFLNIAKENDLRTTTEIGGVEQNRDSVEIQKEIYKRLNPKETLVVFDNVNTYDDIHPFLPWIISPETRSPNVLITSSSDEGHWEEVQPVCDCEIIILKPFDHNEALEFFRSALEDGGYDTEEMGLRDEDIIEIAKILEFIAKYLARAVDSILEKKCSIAEYLSLLRNPESNEFQNADPTS